MPPKELLRLRIGGRACVRPRWRLCCVGRYLAPFCYKKPPFWCRRPRHPRQRPPRAGLRLLRIVRPRARWRRLSGDWSYLRRYPQGPHAADAHRRLAFLAAAFEPPPSFTAIAYDLPPPPPEEIIYIRRPVLVFDDPVFAFAPPPPPPVIFLAPPPPEFVVLVHAPPPT